MIFDKTMSYSLNSLSIPRIYQEYSSTDISIRKIDEATGVIRFSNLLDYAKNNELDLITAGRNICESYGLSKYIAIVNDEKFYMNPSYRKAVLESYKIIPMHLESIGYNIYFYNLLEYCIDYDIKHNTYYTDNLLENDYINGFNDMNAQLSSDKKTAKDVLGWFTGLFGRAGDKISGFIGNQAVDAVNNALGTNKVSQAIASNADRIARNAVSSAIKGGVDEVNNAAAPYLKGAAVTAAIGGGLAVLNNTINNLTNNENMGSHNPGVITKTLNALKKCLGTLTGRQQNAPAGQRGIISRLIAKVKNAIAYLGRKVGITS